MPPLTGYAYFLQNALKYGWVVPQGGIIMWSGAIADIPGGWFFCDGDNGTPDLRDRFIVGAKQDDAGVAKTNVERILYQTGGMLSHSHMYETLEHTHELTEYGHEHYTSHYLEVGTGEGFYPWDYQYPTDLGYADIVAESSEVFTMIYDADVVPPYYALAFIMKS